MDGAWVGKEDLVSKSIDFAPINFEEALPKLDQKFDLCISLEVAEHLSEAIANDFVDFLCTASDVVLFSAATKCQGGTNHINEQWQSYWIDIFESNGYECLDIFRPHLWNNKSVDWWYRQNIFLFVNPSDSLLNLEALKRLEKPIFDVAHPINCEKNQKYRLLVEEPTLRFCIRCLTRWARIVLRKARKLDA